VQAAPLKVTGFSVVVALNWKTRSTLSSPAYANAAVPTAVNGGALRLELTVN
jgi:hypothetical protein